MHKLPLVHNFISTPQKTRTNNYSHTYVSVHSQWMHTASIPCVMPNPVITRITEVLVHVPGCLKLMSLSSGIVKSNTETNTLLEVNNQQIQENEKKTSLTQ